MTGSYGKILENMYNHKYFQYFSILTSRSEVIISIEASSGCFFKVDVNL